MQWIHPCHPGCRILGWFSSSWSLWITLVGLGICFLQSILYFRSVTPLCTLGILHSLMVAYLPLESLEFTLIHSDGPASFSKLLHLSNIRMYVPGSTLLRAVGNYKIPKLLDTVLFQEVFIHFVYHIPKKPPSFHTVNENLFSLLGFKPRILCLSFFPVQGVCSNFLPSVSAQLTDSTYKGCETVPIKNFKKCDRFLSL